MRGLLQEQLDPRLSMKTRRLIWQFTGFVAFIAEGKNDDGVCIRLGKEEMGVRPNVPKDLCCTRENEKEGPPGDCIVPRFTEAKPFYYCCVDSENRPVNPPPDFVVPNKMEAWFAITDKFGCDPCESPERPEGKSCVYYKDRSGQDPPRGPKVAFNARGENQCNNWASKKENVEAFYCGEPPKGESCTPKKTYSYNFETMQPTRSPTPQG